MVRDELSVMSAFLAVADERSFTKAAKRLGVTQSALSHAIAARLRGGSNVLDLQTVGSSNIFDGPECKTTPKFTSNMLDRSSPSRRQAFARGQMRS